MSSENEEVGGDPSIAINFRNGGLAEYKSIIGYQINSGVLSVLLTPTAVEVFPLDTIQTISITQE